MSVSVRAHGLPKNPICVSTTINQIRPSYRDSKESYEEDKMRLRMMIAMIQLNMINHLLTISVPPFDCFQTSE